MNLRLFVLAILFATLASRSVAQPAAVVDSTFHPTLNASLDVHRRDGVIQIDGDLSDAGWQHAAHTKDFTCCAPHPMMRPLIATEAFITYDNDALYVAMIAHDPNPSAIRSTMTG